MSSQQDHRESHADKIARLKRELVGYFGWASPEDAYRCEKLSDELEREEHLARLEAESEQASTAIAKAEPKPEPKSQAKLAACREKVIKPMLDERRWEINDWAQAAGVDWHTADDYYQGKTNPRKFNRHKLATALGWTSLPD